MFKFQVTNGAPLAPVRSASEPMLSPGQNDNSNSAAELGGPIPMAVAGPWRPALASPGSRGIQRPTGASIPWPSCLDVRSPDSVASPEAASPPWRSPVSGWRPALTPDPQEDAIMALVAALCFGCRDEREKTVYSVAEVAWADSNHLDLMLCYQDGPILLHAAKHAIAQERFGECLGRNCDHNVVHFVSRDKIAIGHAEVASTVVAATVPRYQAEAYVRNCNMKQLPYTAPDDHLVVFVDGKGQQPSYALFHTSPAAHSACQRVHGLADRLQLLHEQSVQGGNRTAWPADADPVACVERALHGDENDPPEACAQRWHDLKTAWSACTELHGEDQTREWLQDALVLDVRTLPLHLAAAMDADGVALPRGRLYLRALTENHLGLASFFADAGMGLQSDSLEGVDETFVSLLPHARDAAYHLLQRAPQHITAPGWLAAHALAQQSADAGLSEWLETCQPLDSVLPPRGRPSADTVAARLRHFHKRLLATHNPYLAVCVISETIGRQGDAQELEAWRRLCHAQGIDYLVRPGAYAQSIDIDDIVTSFAARGRAGGGSAMGAGNPGAGAGPV